MKLSELLIELQHKLNDYGDVEVKFGELAEAVRDSKIHKINDLSVENFEYGSNEIILWDK